MLMNRKTGPIIVPLFIMILPFAMCLIGICNDYGWTFDEFGVGLWVKYFIVAGAALSLIFVSHHYVYCLEENHIQISARKLFYMRWIPSWIGVAAIVIMAAWASMLLI